MELRGYQQIAVNAVYDYLRKSDLNPCVVLPTGAGKSIVIAKIVTDAVTLWQGRCLILAHVKELLEQNAAKIAALCPEIDIGIFSAGLNSRNTKERVIIAGIQSVYDKAAQLGSFDLILVDECFTGETEIKTPAGNKKISDLLPGDLVFNASGIAKISAISIRQTKKIIKMRLSNGNIIRCTENHPFFTESGWRKAGKLERGTHLFSMEDVRMLRQEVLSVYFREEQDERTGMGKTAFLFDSLFQDQRKPDECNSSQGKDENKNGGKDHPHAERQRKDSCPASGICKISAGGLDGGVCSNDNASTAGGTCAKRIQNRFCESGKNDRDRTGRRISSGNGTQETGYTEITASGTIRLEDISVVELDRPELVYNLQIEGHPTYYAAGTLVHNCHLIPPDGDGMYRSFLDDMKKINPNIRLIGMTATPYRLKGGLICRKENLLNEVCCEIGVRELIVAGYLSKLRSKNGKYKADLDNLHIRGGEFVAEDVEKAMDNERLVTAACREIAELCKDRKKVLIFASSIDHCRHIAETIREQTHEECGIVTGHTPKLERAEILDRFRGITQKNLFGEAKPELKYLVNVGVLTTGFDAPAIDCVAILRPTNSAGLYYQMTGRGFRLSPDTGKTDCLILDYGGNIMRHGPVDMIRITENPGRKGNGGAPVRECPQCQSVFPAGRTACPDCGYELPREERRLKHDSRACSDGILSGESSELEYPVKDVYYCTHTKRNADEDTPKTMRIDYMIGFSDFQAEWVCPEHTGYARRKFEKWWRERTELDPPDTAAECVQLAQKGYLRQPVAITVRTTAGQRFPEIVKYTFAENEPDAEEAALIAALAEDTAEDVPF